MKPPEELKMRETMHGHGAKGMAFYEYSDTAETGVRMMARRDNSRTGFVETWQHTALPDQTFASFSDLVAALTPLTDAHVAAESAKYPAFRRVEKDTCGNRCRLCPRESWKLGDSVERVRHDTWRVNVAMNWREMDDWFASLCDQHRQQFEGNAAGLAAALQAEVDERKARATAWKEAS